MAVTPGFSSGQNGAGTPSRTTGMNYSTKDFSSPPAATFAARTGCAISISIMEQRPKKILFADDDPLTLRVVGHWLIEAGYEVIEAADGLEALERMQNTEDALPDLILTDWSMPRMDGVELTRRVRELHLAHYPYIIFLSVRSSSSAIVEALEQGADDYLSKPVNQAELLARIETGVRLLDREKYLVWKARTDPLTGLLTQPVFYEILGREWDRSRRYGHQLSCVMFDIDFFKRINDIHGHAAGDAALITVAKLLMEDSRTTDYSCRYGGEEFCVLLPETNEKHAMFWADRVRARLERMQMGHENHQFSVTASFGVAECRPDQRRVEDLVDCADQALLCAKQSGRNRVVQFTEVLAGLELDGGNRPKGLFGDCRAGDIMIPAVACLREDHTLGHAAEHFLRTRISSAPVVNLEGKLVGAVSEKEILPALGSLDAWKTSVSEIMQRNVIWYEEDTAVQVIYDFLCRVSLIHVTIVRDGYPVGSISRSSLLRWVRSLLISKGVLSADSNLTNEELSCIAVAETLQAIVHCARSLAKKSQEAVADQAALIGGATQIQELINELLAHSAYVAKETRKTQEVEVPLDTLYLD